MPRFLYGLTGILLMAVWLGIATRFAMTLQSAEAQNMKGNLDDINNPNLSGAFSINSVLFFVSGSLNMFDPDAKNLNVDWSAFMVQGPIIGGMGNATQVPVEAFGQDPIAIFRDTVARPDLERAQNVTGYMPFRIKAPGLKPIGYLGISDFDQINTDIGLAQAGSSILTAPNMGYPFDVFTGNITFAAANNATITSSGRPGSDIMRINGAMLQDSILGFKVQISSNPTCLDPVAPGCELTITITVQRTGLVKFCVIVVFVVGWIITIAIFLITGEALLLNRSNILEGTDILAICFTALFALPTVRSLLPNVPSSYGCLLDILGILPNVIIVTLCTTFFTNSRLRKRARQAKADAEAKEQAKNT